jgi:hypothetical protein
VRSHRVPGFLDAGAVLNEPHPNRAEHHRRASALLSRTPAVPAVDPNATVFKPADFGADPTGVADSTAALTRAVRAMLGLGRADRKDTFGLYDLGGATLDLSGGIYRVSSPVALPVGYSNFKVMRGTLIADDSFSGPFMLSIGGGAHSCKAPPSTGLSAGNCTLLTPTLPPNRAQMRTATHTHSCDEQPVRLTLISPPPSPSPSPPP